MKLIKKIGNITLDSYMEWVNYDSVQTVISEVKSTISGGVIVWNLAAEDTSKLVEVSSGSDFGFQSKATKDSILSLARNSIDTLTTITTYDDEVINVRFRFEDGAVSVEDLINSRLSDYFILNIYLARI